METYRADVVIVGAGIAGITAAFELLGQGRKVLLLDRDIRSEMGGLAKKSFGGMFFVNTPQQRWSGIRDTAEQAWKDWQSVAEFEPGDHYPRRWAESYVYNCTDQIYNWITKLGVTFFPAMHWVERGMYKPGNSVPRFHMVWGTGHALSNVMEGQLLAHPKASSLLTMKFEHKVDEVLMQNGKVIGVRGSREDNKEPFEAYADITIMAAGGMGGNIERVKQNWHKPWGAPPDVLLNGAHRYADGILHDAVEKIDGHITHVDKNWPYAGGIHHPRSKVKDHGLSIVPPKSALWLDYTGTRIGPMPLIAIREFILSRKTLGGMQTDMDSRVLSRPDLSGQQHPIEGLYAVGEAAGFGGGGMHGIGSLEGTFLGGCVYTARIAAHHIAGKKLV